MDAPSGSVEFVEAEELERLRRRAYGPDADIAGDAAAQARLAELEAARRRSPTAVDAAAEAPAPVRERGPVDAPVGGQPSPSTSLPQPVDRMPVSSGTRADPWWRQRRWPAILVAAMAAFALIAGGYVAGMSRLLTPGPAHTPTESSTEKMPPVPTVFPQGIYVPSPHEILALRSVGAGADRPNDRHGVLASLGISPDGLRRYADFDGLNVWSGESRYGMACLFVAVPDQGIREGYSAEGCSPEGFATIVELPQQTGTSFMRFVLRDDQVAVYVYGRADLSGSQG